jgi:hypothetical protein
MREIHKAWYDPELGPLVTWRSLFLQGWTRATIQEWLGDPDCLGVNPDGGPRVKLYSEARVLRAQEEARAAAAWTSGQRKSLEACSRCNGQGHRENGFRVM